MCAFVIPTKGEQKGGWRRLGSTSVIDTGNFIRNRHYGSTI